MTSATVRERRRWLALVLTMIGSLGGLGVINAVHVDNVDQHTRDEFRRVQQDQDQDMCQLINALLPTAVPAPTSSYGAGQRSAVQQYRARRC